ncbi:hypothetical protein BN1708_009073 [Verticillium longisporum]|uniref:FCP1 homology domain-containing protein n=1 Tax=Verticillium longisporum TaxID=100787 RepID=A0A0G4KDD7_VERLO|nr:hypothetical protein BN1708_009073 [Verticillium longisporum]
MSQITTLLFDCDNTLVLSEELAFEASKSGTLSGTRAGIKVIGYVGPYPADRQPEMEKVLRDAGAVVIMKDWQEFPDILAKL